MKKPAITSRKTERGQLDLRDERSSSISCTAPQKESIGRHKLTEVKLYCADCPLMNECCLLIKVWSSWIKIAEPTTQSHVQWQRGNLRSFWELPGQGKGVFLAPGLGYPPGMLLEGWWQLSSQGFAVPSKRKRKADSRD